MDVFNLDGKWVLTEKGGNKLGDIQASVPGCVHGALLAAGKIEDPFYRDNELKVAWISQSDWIYRREFTLSDDLLKHDRVLLHCDGLDTLGIIKINGTLVGQTDNMFRTWEFDIRKVLRAGINSIDIEFASAVKYAMKRQAEHPLPDWFGNWQTGISGRAWVRKEQCNFGWDWSLAITTAGIWRSISIVAYDTARLSDVLIRQDHSRAPKTVVLNIETAAETTTADANLGGIVRIKHQGTLVTESQLKKMAKSSPPKSNWKMPTSGGLTAWALNRFTTSSWNCSMRRE
jgi:beta-mannosidase